MPEGTNPPSTGGFTLDMSEALRTGVWKDRFDRTVPFWEDADGLQFTEISIKRKPGREFISNISPQGPIRGMISLQEYGTKVLYIGDLANIYRWNLDDLSITTVGSGYSLVEKAGASIWDSGSSIWDSGSSVWDEGVVQATRWDFVNFGSFILAADNIGPIKIKKNNVNFSSLFEGIVSGGTTSITGSGYVIGDTVTFTGGSGSGLTVTVVGLSGTGINLFSIDNFGSGYTNGDTLTQDTTSGSGTGFALVVSLSNAPFVRVRSLAKSGPHIIAINYDKLTTEHPYDFSWCSEDNVDDWIAESTNSAGSLTIREANSELKCIVPLGDNLAVYTENQMFLISYIKAPFYFGYKPVFASGVGAVSASSVIPVDRHNYGLSRRGFFVTDGNSVDIIGDDEGINAYIRRNVATTEYPQVTGYHNKKANEVVWVYPKQDTKPTEEVYYNYNTGAFGLRTTIQSAFAESSIFDRTISGDDNGDIFYEGGGLSPQITTASTRAHDFEDSYTIKEITSMRVGKIGLGTPKIEVGWSENIDDDPVFEESFFIVNSYQKVDLRTAGRYLTLRLSSDSPTDDWEITHIELTGRMRGFR